MNDNFPTISHQRTRFKICLIKYSITCSNVASEQFSRRTMKHLSLKVFAIEYYFTNHLRHCFNYNHYFNLNYTTIDAGNSLYKKSMD